MSTLPRLFWGTSAGGSLLMVHTIYRASRVMPRKGHTGFEEVPIWGGGNCMWILSTRTFQVKFMHCEAVVCKSKATSASWPGCSWFASTRKRVKTWTSASVRRREPGQVCRESWCPPTATDVNGKNGTSMRTRSSLGSTATFMQHA